MLIITLSIIITLLEKATLVHSAGQQGAGTNVPEQDPAGTLVPAINTIRH